MRALQIAAAGMTAQQMRVEVISNNLANMSTTGYKRSISINAEGEVYAYFTDRVQPELLGQFSIAGFTNPKGLEAIGSNLFLETPASGPSAVSSPGQDGLGVLRQGYLEDSSVDPVREVSNLITAQRGYELNSKVITAADQMLGSMVQIK